MKYTPIKEVKTGMVLARNLYGLYGELLLVEGSILTEMIIDKLKTTGINGIYIKDDSSDDPYVKGIISSKLKENTVRAVRNFFVGIERGDTRSVAASFESMCNLLDDIIDEISTDKNAMVNMVDLKVFDEYTYYHCVNVAALSIMVGVSVGLNRRELYRLGVGALLHDVGKIFVPKEILNKQGPLTYKEYEIIKKHSQFGSDYLKHQNAVLPLESIIAVLTHHERYDGKGYPLGLPSSKQTIEGKIIAICDNYDAMTSDRPYREAYSPSEALEHLMGNSGVMFDPKILESFMRKIVPYPVGTVVELSNGKKGIVIENSVENYMRPVVKLLPEEGEEESGVVYDLYNDPTLLNVTILGLDRNKSAN